MFREQEHRQKHTGAGMTLWPIWLMDPKQNQTEG
jgi:hypothetical protein